MIIHPVDLAYQTAYEEAYKTAYADTLAQSIQNLMKNMGFTSEQAMDALGTTDEIRLRRLSALFRRLCVAKS